MNPKCEPYQVKMEKSIEVMKQDFNTIRAGRANAAVLDKITVDYYGTATPIQQIASVSTPEPRMLSIQPWDASALKLIEKAILASDLGINPTNDGKVIRLLFPQLTEERRRDLIKSVKKMTAIILGFRISKNQQLSNWEADELTQAQRLYAATDAWVCREMYLKLMDNPKNPLKSDE